MSDIRFYNYQLLSYINSMIYYARNYESEIPDNILELSDSWSENCDKLLTTKIHNYDDYEFSLKYYYKESAANNIDLVRDPSCLQDYQYTVATDVLTEIYNPIKNTEYTNRTYDFDPTCEMFSDPDCNLCSM